MSSRHLGVLATDSLTRNHTRFTVGALYSGLRDVWEHGVPSLVSHDAHRAVGWTWPFALHIEPGLTRMLGVHEVLDSAVEREALSAAFEQYLNRLAQEESQEHTPRLRELLGQHLDGSERAHIAPLTFFVQPGLATLACPEIFKDVDRDGLVTLSSLTSIYPGVYQCGELALLAHPFLRRSLSRRNNLNHDFLHSLELASVDNKKIVRVRLDPDAVGLASSFRSPLELQYWYGPRFSDDVSKIPIGVARHEADETQRFFHGVSRTEFWWQSRDGQHILEAEELRDAYTFGRSSGTSYGCRYVHSMVNESTGEIHHLDGAIRDYDETAMLARLDTDISSAGKNTDYTKLWRVDGSIQLDTLKTLVHHYFRDNPLVAEYFEGKKPPEVLAVTRVAEEPDLSVHQTLVPYSMNRGDGVRLLYAHRQRSANLDVFARSVLPFFIVTNAGARPAISSETVELRKLLARANATLEIPSNTAIIKSNDLYSEFPPIRHRDRPALIETIEAFRSLVGVWSRLGQDRIVALCVGLDETDRDTYLSVVGHVDDVAAWLRRPIPFPPADEAAGIAWLDDAASYVSTFTPPSSSVGFASLTNISGTFNINRVPLDPAMYTPVESRDGVKLSLAIPPGETAMLAALLDGTLAVKPLLVVGGVTCTRCEIDYNTCACIKFVDVDVGTRITDIEWLGVYWTDRPADPSGISVPTKM